MTCTDLVGTLDCKVYEVLGPNQGMDEWHILRYKGKEAGKLHLDTKWVGKDGEVLNSQQ